MMIVLLSRSRQDEEGGWLHRGNDLDTEAIHTLSNGRGGAIQHRSRQAHDAPLSQG